METDVKCHNSFFLSILYKKFKDEVYYWKNFQKEEVDFVVKNDFKVKLLLQVCCDIENRNTEEGEVRALIKASKELKCNNLLCYYRRQGRCGRKKLVWHKTENKVYSVVEMAIKPLIFQSFPYNWKTDLNNSGALYLAIIF